MTASSPGTVGVSISNPAIPKLPAGGGTSDWNVVQNLGSGAPFFNSRPASRVRQPRCSVAQAREKAAPAVPAAAAPAATAVAAKAATQKKTPAPKKAVPPKREKVKGQAFKGEQKAASPQKSRGEESRVKSARGRRRRRTEEARGSKPHTKIELPRKKCETLFRQEGYRDKHIPCRSVYSNNATRTRMPLCEPARRGVDPPTRADAGGRGGAAARRILRLGLRTGDQHQFRDTHMKYPSKRTVSSPRDRRKRA